MTAEFIKNLQSLFFVANKSNIPKLGKVPGHRGHIGSDQLGKLVDAMLAFGKGFYDYQARRVCQRLEYFSVFA